MNNFSKFFLECKLPLQIAIVLIVATEMFFCGVLSDKLMHAETIFERIIGWVIALGDVGAYLYCAIYVLSKS
jgi:hypothetical protein